MAVQSTWEGPPEHHPTPPKPPLKVTGSRLSMGRPIGPWDPPGKEDEGSTKPKRSFQERGGEGENKDRKRER